MRGFRYREKEIVTKAADQALEQIKTKKYAQELHALGIINILLYGIGIHSKEIALEMEHVSYQGT